MKCFYKFFTAAAAIIIIMFLAANLLLHLQKKNNGRPYQIEIDRLAYQIEQNGIESIDVTDCSYVTNISHYDSACPNQAFFEYHDSDYAVRIINGATYRFDYIFMPISENKNIILSVNFILAIMSLFVLLIIIFIHNKIIKPFETLKDIPYELSKGNLTIPIKEEKYRFFGKFIWGVNMLRENIEQHKRLELDLLKENKTLILSLSHDIKTPLSAIKLYSKALSKGLYGNKEKQLEIAENINAKADEIEFFVSQIMQASSEELLPLDVQMSEFYLSSLADKIVSYYKEKLALIKIDFLLGEYTDCILKGDFDRSVEALQNIIENAIKYGDGHKIELIFSEEEDCRLITVKNSGNSLPEAELPHIFESFVRGSNAGKTNGSGLGLYICRQLMHKMGGEVFAEIKEADMLMTAVFVMAK